ncbi:MAG: PqqD family protein [Porphyromonadaceae bacterium]|nr:PqqD family protein [Porphyromonadaceae bacterium]
MRIKDNLSLRKIADEYIMIADTGDHLDYTKAIGLNETAAYLIESVQGKEFDLEFWIKLLTDRYEVSHDEAQADATKLIEKLIEVGIVE